MKTYKAEAQVLLEIDVDAESEEEARDKMRDYIWDNYNKVDSWNWGIYAYEA